MKPKTLAGQMLELQAAWFEFLATVASPWGLTDASRRLRKAAWERREQWHELERL